MANNKRTSHTLSLSKLRTISLRKLLEAVKKDAAAQGRANEQILAAYERQEAELVRTLEYTRKVLVLLRDKPTTAPDKTNPVNGSL